MKRLLLIFTVLLFFSCEKEHAIYNDADQLRAMEQEILAMIQDKTCTSDRICGAIAFGSKPCGGPWKYLIYSLPATDVAVLQEKVKNYNAMEGEINAREGKFSDCSVVGPPTVTCLDGTCGAVLVSK